MMENFNAKAVSRIIQDQIKYGFTDGTFITLIKNEEFLYDIYLYIKNNNDFNGIHKKYDEYYKEKIKVLN